MTFDDLIAQAITNLRAGTRETAAVYAQLARAMAARDQAEQLRRLVELLERAATRGVGQEGR